MSEDGAAVPRNTAPQLPWGDGAPERADKFLMGAIAVSSLYLIGWMLLTPSLIANHPVLLEFFKGSMTGMVAMGAMSRIGDASLAVAVLAAIPGLMMFDWIYWWAGRRWGRNAIDLFLGNHPKAAARAARIERIFHRYGWIAIVVAYFQPIPNVLFYAAAGWTRMRLIPFLLLDLIGCLLWIALCVGLGYAIGQEAVDVTRAIGRYSLWATGALVVIVVGRQIWTQRRVA